MDEAVKNSVPEICTVRPPVIDQAMQCKARGIGELREEIQSNGG